MKIFISGQKSFGAAVFKMLAERGHEITGVCCPIDVNDALYAAAVEKASIPASTNPLLPEHVPAGTDLIICAHSHAFISSEVRESSKLGVIGYHPSLLPRHRGRDAIKWAIKMNDPLTGGTVYWFDDTVDGGPIAANEWVWIEPGTDASTLWRTKLFPLGLVLINKVVNDISDGHIVKIPQSEAVATWEPSLNPPRLERPAAGL